MTRLLAILLLQFAASFSTGLVDQIRGPVNVNLGRRVAAGLAVETGKRGFVELELNFGSYLRVRENSSVVFDSVARTNLEVRVTRGSALIDADEIDPSAPIKVTAGALMVTIRKPGLYLISKDSVRVFKGHLDLGDGTLLKRGYEAIETDGIFSVRKLDDKEMENPYAPDQVKVFVEPQEGRDKTFMNAVFSEMCREELRKARDVAVVSEREAADFVLVTTGGFDESWRVYARADLTKPDGTRLFSTGEMSEIDNFPVQPSSIQPFLTPGHAVVQAVIYEILAKSGWR